MCVRDVSGKRSRFSVCRENIQNEYKKAPIASRGELVDGNLSSFYHYNYHYNLALDTSHFLVTRPPDAVFIHCKSASGTAVSGVEYYTTSVRAAHLSGQPLIPPCLPCYDTGWL